MSPQGSAASGRRGDSLQNIPSPLSFVEVFSPVSLGTKLEWHDY